MTTKKILGLKADYGSLDLRGEDRQAFVIDAERVLREVGEVMKDSGKISDFYVRHQPSKTIGYAGEVVSYYYEPQKRFAVSLVFSHIPDEPKTRPDGVSGYALYRTVKVHTNRKEEAIGVHTWYTAEDRRPLYGTYPEALMKLIEVMFATHKRNPDSPNYAPPTKEEAEAAG